MQHLIGHLAHAGLEEREARVYLASLSLGEATVQDIAEAAYISRTSTYPIVESLVHTGLLCVIDREGKRLYRADSPERMVDMLQTQCDQLLARKAILERALPELCAFERKSAHRPRVYYYEGREGIMRLSKRFEEKPHDFFEIVPWETLTQFFYVHEFSEHQERLVRGQSRGRILIVATRPPLEEMQKARNQFGWDVRHLAPSEVAETGHVSVKGDEVYAFSYDSVPIGLVIESAPIAATLTRVFELAWEATKKV
ncbi:hypothetical protein HYV72_00055 [Candidatus Uhrbacteria bacterium]|nr:hypothetical protein [Candidatus Uhrbacteria bacterium]